MREAEYVRQIKQTLDCDAPWYFVRITENYDPHRVYVWLLHTPGAVWRCPACDPHRAEARELTADSHTPERAFLCLDSPRLTIYVRVAIPRVCCPDHGLREVDVPWTTNGMKWQRMDAVPLRSGEPSDS
jgi:hypothetical protein